MAPKSRPRWCARRPHELFALDIIGFGASAKPSDFDYSIAVSADQLAARAGAEGVREVVVLVNGHGHTMAQELLARQCDGR